MDASCVCSQEGALQPVINLLGSSCSESQREAALLLGQFATQTPNDDGPDYKSRIVQRGAVPPLIRMLSSPDTALKEMAAFALGRLAQNTHNQAGIVQVRRGQRVHWARCRRSTLFGISAQQQQHMEVQAYFGQETSVSPKTADDAMIGCLLACMCDPTAA
jgi:hypothetical protein